PCCHLPRQEHESCSKGNKLTETAVKLHTPKTPRRKPGTTRGFRFDDKTIELFAALLKDSADRAIRSLDAANREVKLSMSRIAIMEKAHAEARKRWRSEKPQAGGKVRHLLNPVKRELVDHLSRHGDKQFQIMATQIDRANRYLEELGERIDRLKAKQLPSLKKFRSKVRARKPATASSRLQRLERGRR
ncbi:MAG: hypothetical protein OEV08_03745, partial [Nitrospira sp.]|nr:hypothetical protein [Nitrospira sp.]